MAQSVFERAGGFATVRKIVSDFYDKVLDSPRLQRHFANVEMARLIDHQTKFVSQVMGGPASFSDDRLKRVHAPMRVTRAEFEEIADLLCESMEDHGLADDDVRFVREEVMRREIFIVSAHEADV